MNEQEELTALRRLAELEAKAKDAPVPTRDQLLRSSAVGRTARGMRDPLDAAASLVPNALGYVTSAGGRFDNPVSEFFKKEAADVDQMNVEDETTYQNARKATGSKPDDWDVVRGAGAVVPTVTAAIGAAPVTVPRAAMSMWQVIRKGLAGGAIGGALEPINTKEGVEDYAQTKMIQTGVGMGTGGLIAPALVKGVLPAAQFIASKAAPYLDAALDRLKGTPGATAAAAATEANSVIDAALKDIGAKIHQVPQEIIETLRAEVKAAIQSGRKLDAAAALRKAEFETEGMPSTLGQITRDPVQYTKERNLRSVAGVGDPLQQTFNEQSRNISGKLENLARGAAPDRLTAGERLVTALRTLDASRKGSVDAAYTTARADAGKDMDVPLGGLASDVAGIVEDYADKIPSAVMAKLKSFGLMGDSQTRVFNFEEANRLLQTINANRGIDPSTNGALTKLDLAVKRAMTDEGAKGAVDPFAVPRGLARDRFQLLREVPALQNAVDDVIPDDFVRKNIVAAPTRDVVALANLLRETAPEAFEEARRQIGVAINKAAFKGKADGDVSPTALANVLEALGDRKLGAFYSPEEVAQLHRLSRNANNMNTFPAGNAVSTSNSNPMAMVGNYSERLPGPLGTAARAATAVAQPVLNSLAVNKAVQAQVPSVMSPSQIARERLATTLSAYGSAGALQPYGRR